MRRVAHQTQRRQPPLPLLQQHHSAWIGVGAGLVTAALVVLGTRMREGSKSDDETPSDDETESTDHNAIQHVDNATLRGKLEQWFRVTVASVRGQEFQASKDYSASVCLLFRDFVSNDPMQCLVAVDDRLRFWVPRYKPKMRSLTRESGILDALCVNPARIYAMVVEHLFMKKGTSLQSSSVVLEKMNECILALENNLVAYILFVFSGLSWWVMSTTNVPLSMSNVEFTGLWTTLTTPVPPLSTKDVRHDLVKTHNVLLQSCTTLLNNLVKLNIMKFDGFDINRPMDGDDFHFDGRHDITAQMLAIMKEFPS